MLETIRRREEELEAYRQLCRKIGPIHHENSIKKRKSHLILEYPFLTDSASVNEARLKAKNLEESKTLEDWISQVIPLLNHEKRYQQQKILRMIEKAWPKVQMINVDSEGKMGLGELTKVPLEDIACVVPSAALLHSIESSSMKPISKEVYSSYAKSIISYSRNGKKNGYRKAVNKRGVSLDGLAYYFEYLEERCKEAYSDKAYRDLLDIRLLFYVPLPLTTLNKITRCNVKVETIDAEFGTIKRHFIEYADHKYPVPSMIIEFVSALIAKNKPLLNRNGKQLNVFVEKSIRAAKIGEKITPKLIQNSLSSICRLEGYFPEWLPPR